MNFLAKIKNREISGRWFLGSHHITLILIGLIFYRLQRTPLQILVCLFCGFLTEILFYKFTNKYTENKLWDRLFSTTNAVFGLLLLLKSHLWWFYGVVVVITVTAKYLLRKTQNSHIFNPTNFAIVMVITFFPSHWFASLLDEYMLSWYPMLHVTIFGLLAVWLGRTYVVSFAYILSLIFWCLLFFPVKNFSELILALGPEFGAIGLIFLFLMITDPKTVPYSYKAQAVYAFVIAFIHILLRYEQYLYSRYVALFIVTLAYYLFSIIKEPKVTT